MINQHTFESHAGLLIIPQGIWSEKDKDGIINSIEIKKESEIYSESWFYHDFILRPFQREEQPQECRPCTAVKGHFKQLLGEHDYIFYINGPYLGGKEENYLYLKVMISSLFNNEKVKKVYFLYIESIVDLGFKDMKMNDKKFTNENFSNALINEKIVLKVFLDLCQNLNIISGTVYEIMRDYTHN